MRPSSEHEWHRNSGSVHARQYQTWTSGTTCSYIILDGAGLTNEGDRLNTLIKGAKQSAMVGDHKQLQPVVHQSSMEHDYNVSNFEIMNYWAAIHRETLGGCMSTMLTLQFRMQCYIAYAVSYLS